MLLRVALAFLVLAALAPGAAAQDFYFGNDLSYVNQMEDCGAVYKEGGVPKDPYRIFADHGSNLVRVRLWVDPAWQNGLAQPEGVKDQYSDLDDVRETIARAHGAGMDVLLDLHYSDFWADPGRQVVPARWLSVATDTDALADSVYQYTKQTLATLDAEGLMPEMVQVGNETNPGMLVHTGMNGQYEATGTVDGGWERQATLFNASIRAVREVGATASVDPRIVVHFANPAGIRDRVRRLVDAGVTDFDVVGISFYYAYHELPISQVGVIVRDLRSRYPAYDVAIVETGYLWSTQNADALPNSITTPDPGYLPVAPETQLEYQVDLTREMMRSGALGVVFWEPAWVSTACRTPWGQGSSHDHVAFFSPTTTDFIATGGGAWAEPRFYLDPEAPKTTLKVKTTGVNVAGGVYLVGEAAGEAPIRMVHEGDRVYSAPVYLSEGTTARYHFAVGADAATREAVPDACASGGERQVTVGSDDAEIGYVWGTCEAFDVTGGEATVTFAVDMTGQDVSRGVYLTGVVTGWGIVPMTDVGGGVYRYQTTRPVGDEGAYYFLTTPTWDNYQTYRERVPAACAVWYGSDRGYAVPAGGATFAFGWGSCAAIQVGTPTEAAPTAALRLLPTRPNPVRDAADVRFEVPAAGPATLAVHDLLGRRVRTLVDGAVPAGPQSTRLETAGLPAGTYLVRLGAAGASVAQAITVVR